MMKRSLAVAIATSLASTAALSQETSGIDTSVRIEEIAVIGRYVPDEKRNTSALSNVLTNEEFSRSGDSNIAEGLKRVAGLSLVGGKFVYVRGLGERYSSTLLNGSTMPSPEPLNRVIPLDLFPNAIMDSVVVQKTYSAQFPSEFGGGVLQLRTKKATDSFFFNMSSSVGMTEEVSFKKGFTADGGDSDWLGYDDGSREIPSLLKQATANGQKLIRKSPYLNNGGYSPEELQAIGQSLPASYEIDSETLPADVSIGASLGNFHDLGSSRLSYMAAVDYKNSWDQNEIERNSYALGMGEELTPINEFTFYGTENNIDVSTILSGSLDITPDHNIRTTSILLRKTDDTASQLVGYFGADSLDARINEIEFIEHQLLSNQIQGDHYFPDANELTINWRYNRSTAERDAPDTRIYRYDLRQDGYRFSTRADANVRRYSMLEDRNEDYGVDLSMVFYGPAASTITVSGGYAHQDNTRDFGIRRFTFFEQGDVVNRPGFLYQPLSSILAQENIGPSGFELRETTRPTDAYDAERNLEAFYAQTEINLDDRIQLLIGVRQEDFQQNVNTFDLFRPDDSIRAQLESKDILPGITATYIMGNHQFRAGYSETTSRPDFRELSPATFTNPVTGYEVVGNPDLKLAYIKNYDLRWEWYFSNLDSMSLGLFYKDFSQPIESVVVPGANSVRGFINAESAENSGIELELRKQLDFLGERWSDFYVSGNASFIDSEVSIGTDNQNILTNTTRPLQGQSDWLFNGQLGYDSYNGLTATLLFHYFGERIYEVGILGAPDLIEEPRGELDLVVSKEFMNNWKLSFKAQNLTDEALEITQGGLITTGYRNGRSVSAKIEYRL